jgi:hypothetical protein
MTGPNAYRYNIALFIFFVPYILFEVPSNLILKKIKPSTWLSLIMVLWGERLRRSALSSSQANVIRPLYDRYGTDNHVRWTGCNACPTGLLRSRTVSRYANHLRPGIHTDHVGCVYLISMYYKRYELQWRFTLFFTASIIAGAFGGVSPLTMHFGIY